MAQEEGDILTSVCQYKLKMTDLFRVAQPRLWSFSNKTFQGENVETPGAGRKAGGRAEALAPRQASAVLYKANSRRSSAIG